MRQFFVLFGIFVLLAMVVGCDRVSNPVQQLDDNILGGDGVIPMPPSIIESSHVYENSSLLVSIPGYDGMVKLVEQFADESGAPEIVLLTVDNNSVIQRDSLWFSEVQMVKWFAIEPVDHHPGFIPFYWLSGHHTIEEYAEDFLEIEAPVIIDHEIRVSGSLTVFFERSEASAEFAGLRHRTRIGRGGPVYTQWAVWSTRSTEEKGVWGVSFTNPVRSLDGVPVTISSVLMTEAGDYEIHSNEVLLPYTVGQPFNLIE